jgi:predicted solute-binding protein
MIPAEIVDALLLGGVALGGSSLLSAYPRHFYLLLPIFGIWIVFVATKVLSIQIQKRG